METYQLGLYEKAMPDEIGWLERLQAAKQAGFDFVEISIDETDARLARLDWTRAQRLYMCNLIRIMDMPIRTMCLSGHRKYPLGSHDPKVRMKGLQLMEKAIGLACDLGVRIIQLAGYDVYYESSDNETRRVFVENLKKGVQMASAKGVLLGFETMETSFMDTIVKAMQYVDLVRSPYLGVYPDLGNLTNAAHLYNRTLMDEFEAGRGRILAMHIKETAPGKYRDMRFGSGEVDFSSGIAMARAQGVSCFVAECWHDGSLNWRSTISEVNYFVRAQFSECGIPAQRKFYDEMCCSAQQTTVIREYESMEIYPVWPILPFNNHND